MREGKKNILKKFLRIEILGVEFYFLKKLTFFKLILIWPGPQFFEFQNFNF